MRRSTKFGPTCTDGDRMCCGVDFSIDRSSGYVNVFFTKNGKQVRTREERQERGGGGEMKTWIVRNNIPATWKLSQGKIQRTVY